MKLVLPEQMREIDRYTIEKLGIPGIVLMECAALGVVEEVRNLLGDISSRKIIIFAGKGNNGGDALAAARHLFNLGADVTVLLLAPENAFSGDAAQNLAILTRIGCPVNVISPEKQTDMDLKSVIKSCDLVMDGIFGTGLKGAVTGFAAEVIDTINRETAEYHKPVVAIDIPSGVNGATGQVANTAVKATLTVTFGFSKPGLHISPGCHFAGKVIVKDIGIPAAAYSGFSFPLQVIERSMIARRIKPREPETNKSTYGRILMVGGSAGLTGSIYMSGMAALRTGSGLVTLSVPLSLLPVYEIKATELMTLGLEDEGRGFLSAKCIPELMETLPRMDAAVIGPGLSTKEDIGAILRHILESCDIPIVIDADGLNVISRDFSILENRRCPVVLTPHPGEMARLVGSTAKEIQANRLEYAREFARKWEVVLVLKGSNTLVAGPDGEVFINPTGNPGMATGGTGDILAGIIASLLGQGLPPLEAAAAGTWIHGVAGDRAASKYGEYGMIASDLLEEIPGVLKSLTEGP